MPHPADSVRNDGFWSLQKLLKGIRLILLRRPVRLLSHKAKITCSRQLTPARNGATDYLPVLISRQGLMPEVKLSKLGGLLALTE